MEALAHDVVDLETARAERQKRGGPRHVIEVPKNELVGELMDFETLTFEAIDANGYALQQVRRLPPGPWRDELMRAHIAAHDASQKLITRLRMAVGRYEAERALTR
jgi:hypothetical protein